ATLGSIWLTTGLDPAMTLGCGGYGGNITSENISPRHLLNIKRLAYEIAPVGNRFAGAGSGVAARRAVEKGAVGNGDCLHYGSSFVTAHCRLSWGTRLSTSGHTGEGWHRFR